MLNSTETLSNIFQKITTETTLDELILAASSDPRPQPPNPFTPAVHNPAVISCCEAYMEIIDAAAKQGISRYSVISEAENAYRETMPPPSSPSSIRDFVACVTYGMVIRAISSSEGTRFLYAAQIAHNTRLKRTKRRVKPNKSNNISSK
jgi:hypothetical protein